VASAAVPPKPASNPVYDGPDVLTPAEEKQIGDRLVAFKKAKGIEVGLAIVPTLGDYDIRQLGYETGEAWGLGDKERNDGILMLIIADKARAAKPGANRCGCVTIEVGSYLEGDLTDTAVGALLDRDVMGPLTSGDFFKAADGGLQGVVTILSDGEAAKVYKQTSDSGGKKKQKEGWPWWVWLIGIGVLIFLQILGVPVLDILLIFLSSGGGGSSRGGGGGYSGGNSVGGGGSFGGGGASR